MVAVVERAAERWSTKAQRQRGIIKWSSFVAVPICAALVFCVTTVMSQRPVGMREHEESASCAWCERVSGRVASESVELLKTVHAKHRGAVSTSPKRFKLLRCAPQIHAGKVV